MKTANKNLKVKPAPSEEELKKSLDEIEKQKTLDCQKELEALLKKYNRSLDVSFQYLPGRGLKREVLLVKQT